MPRTRDESLHSHPQGETTVSGNANQIFISYRREDSAAITGRIYDRLTQEFGRETIFKDVDSIPLGVNFRKHLDSIISECAVALVVIGDRWLVRLDDPRDFVRIEIESALQRNIPVIPLLVQSATLPPEESLPETLRELSDRHGMTIGHDPHFHVDISRLIASLKTLLQPSPTYGFSRGEPATAKSERTGAVPPSDSSPDQAEATTPPPDVPNPATVPPPSQPLPPERVRASVKPTAAQVFETTAVLRILTVISGVLPLLTTFVMLGLAGAAFDMLVDVRADLSAKDTFALLIAEMSVLLTLGSLGYYWGTERPQIDWKGGLWVSALPLLTHVPVLAVIPFLKSPPYPAVYIVNYTAALFATLLMPLFSSVGWHVGRERSQMRK